MELGEAIKNTKNRIKSWENIAEIGKHALSKEEYENSQNICEEQKVLIEELDRLQEENKELQTERNTYRTQVNSAFDKGFIHKDKIREKIEEINKEEENLMYKNNIIHTLQELLREE